MTANIENLERLARLRDQGVLTQAEFEVQKSLLLSAPEPSVASSELSATQPTALSEEQADFSWNPFHKMASASDAARLADTATLAAIVLALDECTYLASGVWDAINGRVLDPGFSNATVVGILVAVTAFWALLLAWLGRLSVHRRSRAATIAILVIALLGVVAKIDWFLGGPNQFLRLTVVLTAAGLVLAIQAVRGVYGLRRFEEGLPSAAQKATYVPPRSTSATPESGIEASRPLRHAIRWVGLVLLLAVAAAAAFWASQPRSSRVETDVAAAQPSTDMRAVPIDPTAALIGTWVGEPDWCASGAAINLDGGGRFSGEGYEGSWLFLNGRLTTSSRSSYDGEGDQVQQANATVQIISRDEIVLDWGDGATRYRRCVGDVEPWNPAG